MKIEELNSLIENRANSQVKQTLALFFDKLKESIIKNNNIKKYSYEEQLVCYYIQSLHNYVDAKLNLHKLRKRINVYNCSDWAIKHEYDYVIDVRCKRNEKNHFKNLLLKNKIEVPKSNYPHHRPYEQTSFFIDIPISIR